ncbi:NADH dehydrogenase subunit 6 (mitochondrion) [Ramazzottius varieornatus]|uniref:NADH dehydrogenase subunit 6 n=1 Tax=Ramazzottius varieornatus TaxID=947166 RepID=A0A1C9ZW94_RAMVA|nr:NADH dehydrogenase subunit 6 [Ramazzottius varieornatus]BAV58170.1 NADH dehydrogenase subunit 6 [Ramazzottius varieornatus]
MKEIMIMSSITLWFFSLFQHPLILVGILTVQSAPAIYSALHASHSGWMAFLLFLIFLGGLLIIFVYLSALIPNEIFLPSRMENASFSLLALLPILWSMKTIKFSFFNHSQSPVSDFAHLFYHNMFTFMLCYLFISLTATMYITSKYKTPMKSSYYDKYTKNPPPN